MTGEVLEVVLLGPAATQYSDGLHAGPSASMRFVSLEGSAIEPGRADALRGADVLVSRIFPAAHPMPKLALLQVPSAGIETIDLAGVPSGIAVCNTFGHEQAIAEYVVHGAIGILRGLRKEEASFRRDPDSPQGLHGRPLAREFSGCRVGIIGLGHIGRAVERLCLAFGCEIRVCSRMPARESGASRWYPPSDLDGFFEGLEVVVVACALTPGTVGLVKRRHLGVMRAGVLINVARAEIVVEDDLADALSSGVLQGAVLDVWGTSAYKPGRFEALCNVMMTPHISAWTVPMRQRRLAQILANLVALRDGLPLANLVRAPRL